MIYQYHNKKISTNLNICAIKHYINISYDMNGNPIIPDCQLSKLYTDTHINFHIYTPLLIINSNII